MMSTEVGPQWLSVVRTWRSIIHCCGAWAKPITRAASTLPNLLEIWAPYQDIIKIISLRKREGGWIAAGQVQTLTPVLA